MKARIVQTKTFAETTAAALDVSVIAFLRGLGEADFVSLAFVVTTDATHNITYAAQLVYTI